MVNPVRTMGHVSTSSTNTDVTVLQASMGPTAKTVCNITCSFLKVFINALEIAARYVGIENEEWMSTYVKFSGVYFWAFHGSVRNCLLHNMLSLQILTTVMVNPVGTMEHVWTLSTIINVTVLRVSTEPTVRPVWNLPLFISTLKINSISRGVFEVFAADFFLS